MKFPVFSRLISDGFLGQAQRIFLNVKRDNLVLRRKLSVNEAQVEPLGQPSFRTHPHLLKRDELVPGLSLEEFKQRRERLVENILMTKQNLPHVVLVPSSSVQYMTEKIPYIFRQNTDFRYLTGCLEPDSALVILIESENKHSSTIFLRERNRHSELWEGPRTGVENAPAVFGVDESRPIHDLELFLKNIQNKNFTLWYDTSLPANIIVHKLLASFISVNGPKKLLEIRNKIHELRLIKSSAEQQLLLKSAEITSDAFEVTMRNTKPGITEHQLFATVDYHCRMNGAEYLAYPPVVAAGDNANVIHYINNTQQVRDGDLVLMDAGCELHGYCSDITRTWPANGTFTPFQKTLYDIVLSVQLDLLSACKEECSLDDLFTTMCKLLGQRLSEGHVLSKGVTKTISLDQIAFKLCPHHVGHYLGMDVHDTATITRKVKLQKGMLITVEPGVYINARNELAKPEFRGIGIRIEDDVLFTDSGPKVISTCPKSVEDIESLFKR